MLSQGGPDSSTCTSRGGKGANALDIESLSGHKPGPGTLYGALARLEARKWIEPLAADDRRRPYRLTAAGQRVLRHRLQSLQALARVGRSRLSEA